MSLGLTCDNQERDTSYDHNLPFSRSELSILRHEYELITARSFDKGSDWRTGASLNSGGSNVPVHLLLAIA